MAPLPSRPYGIGSVGGYPEVATPRDFAETTQKNWVASTLGVAFVSAHEVIVAVIDANGRAKAQQGARGQCVNPLVASPIIL
jgi:hypothetical protein